MSAPAPAAAPSAFKLWLRRELLRELRLGAIFLLAGIAVVFAAGRLWSGFDARWTRLNHQLTYVALELHPNALLDQFSRRLSTQEYGWGFFSATEPFNVSSARAHLHADFPEFVGFGPDGKPVVKRSSSRRRVDPAALQARADQYVVRHQHLEARRFTRLYHDASAFDSPAPTDVLARSITKILGVPDALLHLLRNIIASGVAGILLLSGTLGIAAVALHSSKRPTRWWLKLLVWPFLASALGWVTIGFMSVGAAVFGGLTVNTSALSVLAGAPLLYLAAKAPLCFLEELRLKPTPWDGVERRQATRPPFPPADTPPAPSA